MAIIKQQANWNDSVQIGPQPEESVSQSFFFEKDFSLDSVTVQFDSTNVDLNYDVKFKCEMRPAVGPDYLVDLSESPPIFSAWINDENIPPTKVTFTLGGTFNAGFYYFTIVSNMQVRETCLLSYQKGGTFLGKFLNKEFGTGIYRNDQALFMKVNGSWVGTLPKADTIERGVFTTSTLQDGT